VRDVGHGSLEKGERALDRFVVKMRRKAATERRKLPA
jgi:hypothetical protein